MMIFRCPMMSCCSKKRNEREQNNCCPTMKRSVKELNSCYLKMTNAMVRCKSFFLPNVKELTVQNIFVVVIAVELLVGGDVLNCNCIVFVARAEPEQLHADEFVLAAAFGGLHRFHEYCDILGCCIRYLI